MLFPGLRCCDSQGTLPKAFFPLFAVSRQHFPFRRGLLFVTKDDIFEDRVEELFFCVVRIPFFSFFFEFFLSSGLFDLLLLSVRLDKKMV